MGVLLILVIIICVIVLICLARKRKALKKEEKKQDIKREEEPAPVPPPVYTAPDPEQRMLYSYYQKTDVRRCPCCDGEYSKWSDRCDICGR